MVHAKQIVRDLLDRLPDECSMEDVLYHLYVARRVESGLEDAAAGRLVTHEEVEREFRRRWTCGAGD